MSAYFIGGKPQEVSIQWNADVITCISTLPNESAGTGDVTQLHADAMQSTVFIKSISIYTCIAVDMVKILCRIFNNYTAHRFCGANPVSFINYFTHEN